MTISTPSGHQVEVKNSLTYGDRRAIKRLMTDRLNIKIENGQSITDSLPASIMMDIEEEIFKRVILSITLADGSQVSGDLLETVYGWPEADGEAVFEYINQNFNSVEEISEKKV